MVDQGSADVELALHGPYHDGVADQFHVVWAEKSTGFFLCRPLQGPIFLRTFPCHCLGHFHLDRPSGDLTVGHLQV